MESVPIVILFAIASSNAEVISKLDPGPRYQYIPAPYGILLQDLWVKASDLAESQTYDAEKQNGYHLFTRKNRSISQPIPLGQADVLAKSNYDPGKRTVVLVHGWQNLPTSPFNAILVPAFLAADDVNVIMTDWSIGAAGNYVVAVLNCIKSGESVARYLSWLVAASGGSLSRFHLVGHSLGGHQVGIVGRSLGGVVPYITSLDPALPGWVTNPFRFRPDDGLYTEVIHTNTGLSGVALPTGLVDFYPNGGASMPGCGDRSCNHNRCIYYFAESLTGGFLGNQCESLATALVGNCDGPVLNMGGLRPKPGSTGIYYLETNAEAPFSIQ